MFSFNSIQQNNTEYGQLIVRLQDGIIFKKTFVPNSINYGQHIYESSISFSIGEGNTIFSISDFNKFIECIKNYKNCSYILDEEFINIPEHRTNDDVEIYHYIHDILTYKDNYFIFSIGTCKIDTVTLSIPIKTDEEHSKLCDALTKFVDWISNIFVKKV